MSHSIHILGEQLFSKNAQNALQKMAKKTANDPDFNKNNFQWGTIVIISCSFAVEATANGILQQIPLAIKIFDELRIKSKIEFIFALKNQSISWGEKPYQSMANLLHLRNRLVHFKKSRQKGLVNPDMEWAESPDVNENILDAFSLTHCTNLYKDTIQVILDMMYVSDLFSDYTIDQITTEKFEPYILY